MVLEELPFKIQYTEGVTTNITQFVTQIDAVRYQGTGKVRSASFMLNAEIGAFITNANYTGISNTPIVNQFDSFQIDITDDNDITKKIIVEVDQELGQKNVKGNLLPLELKAREAALQRKKVTAYYQFKTPKFVISDLILRYNNAHVSLTVCLR